MFIKKHIFSLVLAFVFVCAGISANAKSSDVKSSQTTEDAAIFSKRIDETTAIVNIISRYSSSAENLQKEIETFNDSLKNLNVEKDLGLKKGSAFVENEEAKKNIKDLNLALKTSENLKTKAVDLQKKYTSLDASASTYKENVAALDKEWETALSDIKTLLKDKDSKDFENLNLFGVEALSNYISNINDTLNTIKNKLKDAEDKISKKDFDDLEASVDTLKKQVGASGAELEKASEDFDDKFFDDKADENDADTKKNDEKDDEKDDENKGDDSSSSAAGSSLMDASGKRIPYCTRSAGVAGKGDVSGGSSGGVGGTNSSGVANGPANPAACSDIADIYKILELKSKGLDFSVFLNAMKGFNQNNKNGKLAILDFTQPGSNKRFYLMDLSDKKYPKLVAWEKSSHGSGNGAISNRTVGASTLMSNGSGTGKSSIGFSISSENYVSSKDWPIRFAGNYNGKRMKGLEPGYNSSMLSRGCVMHSASSSGWANGYAPTSLCCVMFDPIITADIIHNKIGMGTLLFINNVIPGDYFKNSAILNGNHGISDECK